LVHPPAYTHLLFDADGTLFDYERAEAAALQHTLQTFDLPFSPHTLQLYQTINQDLWQALERGAITPAALRTRRFELLLEALALPRPRDGLTAAIMSDCYLGALARGTDLLPGALELLQALHGRYHLVVVTNGLSVVQRSRLASSPLNPLIEALIISEELGVAKPAPAFFQAALARLGHPPKAGLLMIGDSLSSDIQGGCDFGLDTCWYNPGRRPRPADLPITYEIAALSELLAIL
jgi:2-haloacid dehalogenase